MSEPQLHPLAGAPQNNPLNLNLLEAAQKKKAADEMHIRERLLEAQTLGVVARSASSDSLIDLIGKCLGVFAVGVGGGMLLALVSQWKRGKQ